MFRHSTESLESNLWCFFNINFNTGAFIYSHTSTACVFPFTQGCNSCFEAYFFKKELYTYVHFTRHGCGEDSNAFFVHLFSLYWMSPILTAQPTARQPSCTRRTSGSTRRGCRLLSSRVGVIVDTCDCLQCIKKKNVRHKSKDYTDHVMKNDHSQSDSFLMCLSHSCCYSCIMLCCGITFCRCCCWAVAC